MCTFASKNRPFGASLQKVKKTRIAGLCGWEVGACVHLPLSCTQIERADFRAKQSQLLFKSPICNATPQLSSSSLFCNSPHKGRTSRLDVRMGNDAIPLGKIAHSDPYKDGFQLSAFYFLAYNMLDMYSIHNSLYR